MSITIRRFEPDDHTAWRALWLGYCDFYNAAVPDAVTEETWRRVSSGDGPIFGFCAALDARMIGIVHYLFHPVTWATGPRCYLEDLFVAPDVRGHGAGRALIEAVYAEADSAGADQVYWLTHTGNETARALYDRVGAHQGMIKYRRK